MTISYNWLKEYIDITETPEAVGQILTSTGLEVESIHEFESVKGGLKGLLIGQVLTCDKHPNADKLSITTVDVGQESPLRIVCGAPNVRAGQKVVVAIPGTTIYPMQGDPFTIKLAKIRGEQSEGMICAEDEIGLGQSHDGIMILDPQAVVGTSAAEHFDISTDYIFEIGLTPNRADAASHYGVARDLRAALDRNLQLPDLTSFKVDNTSLSIPVEVENSEACPRYSALTMTGIKVAESPAWLKTRLQSIGLTPINNIVDITNYVCHSLGQPMHAFDADAITGGKVLVKTLPSGTPFVTLDGVERKLYESDLMICNAEKPMCIAGVFGGTHSGITNDTKNLFLESAYFATAFVRKTSMQHQLKTDASFRFERGTDPNMTVFALRFAALLIKEIAGGNVSSEIVDSYPAPISNQSILIKQKNITRLIGKAIGKDESVSILKRLDINIQEDAGDSFVVSVPPYRVDVLQEADVIEEILRIYGFNNIPLTSHARTDYLAEFPAKDVDKFKWTLGELLNGNGFNEIWTNSLTNAAYQTRSNLTFQGEPIEILNKLSEEQGILRQTMLFSGLEACAYNINRKQKDLRLYEFGKVYSKTGAGYEEKEVFALFMTGNNEEENWQRKSSPISYHDLAQHVHHIISKSGISETLTESVDDQLFEYAARLSVKKNEIGILGKIKSSILKGFGIKQDLFYAELNTTLLFSAANPMFVVKEVPKFPEVRRDVSLVLDQRVTFDEIEKLVRSTEKRLIKNIVVFDVYEGEKIPEGKKAYAMGFTLLDEDKTLTDQEIDKTMDRLMNAFEQKLGAMIRK